MGFDRYRLQQLIECTFARPNRRFHRLDYHDTKLDQLVDRTVGACKRHVMIFPLLMQH